MTARRNAPLQLLVLLESLVLLVLLIVWAAGPPAAHAGRLPLSSAPPDEGAGAPLQAATDDEQRFPKRERATPAAPWKTTKRQGCVLPCVGAQLAAPNARSSASRGTAAPVKSLGKMERRAAISCALATADGRLLVAAVVGPRADGAVAALPPAAGTSPRAVADVSAAAAGAPGG